MILLFIFISGWLKIHCWTEKEDRKELTMFLAVSTILSLLFSSVIIFPVSLSIMNSARGEGLLDQFNNIVLSPQNEIDMKGCMLVGLMFPLAVIMLNGLKWKRKGKEYSYHKWICVILLVSLIIPGTELIWHGGSRVAWPVRYVFLIAFVLIDFSFSILQQNEKVFIRRIYLIEILCVLAAGMLPVKMKEAYMTSEVFSVFGNRGLCFIVYGLFLTGYIISLNYRKLALTFIGLEMVCVAIVCVPERSAGINYIFDIQTIKNETGLKPSVFERVKNQDHSFQDNYSFVMDCSSLSNFVHVIDKNLQTIFRNLGYSTVYTRLLDTGGTVFSDALLNEKYVVTKKTLPEELYIEHDFVQTERGADYYIYETKYTLPIGLIMSDIHKEAVGNVFENQNLFFRDITGLDKELIHDVTYLLKENGSDVHLSVEQKKAIYILCEEGCAGTVQIRLNNQDFLFPDYNYPSMFDNNLLELGVFEDENVTIEIEKTTDFELNKLHIGLLDLGLLDKVCEENNKRENEFLIDIHDTGLTLELFSNSGKYVFFPIPFDSGWKSIVNGSRQEVSSQFGFIAVQIENGQNHIELKYIPNGSKQGIIITFVGVGLGIAFYLFNKKYAKSRAIWFMKNAIYYVYFVLFLCLIFGMYILPGIVYSVLYLI